MSRSNKICEDKFSTNNVRLKFKDNEKDSILNMIIIQDLNTKIQIEKLKNTLEQNKIIELERNKMLSNISHEFKTPVNVIYSTAQLLDLEKTQNYYKKLHEYNKYGFKNNKYSIFSRRFNYVYYKFYSQ